MTGYGRRKGVKPTAAVKKPKSPSARAPKAKTPSVAELLRKLV